MAIQPDISLGVRPPQQQNDPLESFGRILALKHAIQTQQQQQQMMPLQMQEAQERLTQSKLQTQQTQQAITDDKSSRDFFSQNPNATDQDIIAKLGPKVGHSIVQDRYKSQESQLKMAGEKLDMLGRIAGSIKDESTLHGGVQAALQGGLIQPEEAAQLHQQGWTPQTQAIIAQHASQGMKAKEQVDAALAQLKDKRDQAEAAQKAALAGPTLAKAQQEAVIAGQKASGTEPVQPEAKARLAGEAETRSQTAQRDTANQRHQRALEAIQQRRVAIEGGTTMMVPQQDGSYQSVRVKPGESVPAGAVSVAGMNSLTVPTAASRSMTEAAPKVISFVDRINQLVDQQEKKLGPASSRFREFIAGKVGASDPEYTKLRTDVGLLQTALMRMHVGARGGSQMMDHFKELIDASKQDPDNLRAALSEIKDYANTVAGGHSGGAPATGSNPKAPAVGAVEDGHRFKGGDPSKPENWQRVK